MMQRVVFFFLACSLTFSVLAEAIVLRNQVASHPSPYLAMHGKDPVAWQVWSPETLELARKLNRPLLVSVGYFSCHWCHVMQRESYHLPAIAKLLNENFIPVKVDRELEPALDAHLIDFVQMTRGQAGWPLNVFLTPEGHPIIGVTYLPAQRFEKLLKNLDERWDADPDYVRKLASDVMNEWRTVREKSVDKKAYMRNPVQRMLRQTSETRDELGGGFGQQNKFPMVEQLRTLLWISKTQNDHSQDDFIALTLDRMALQGMRDQVGDGFFRYVTDPAWQVPHYEKMLYDNAQLAVLYLQAAKQFDDSEYRDIGLSTVDFMLREFTTNDGLFISSFSAVDDQGREGYYYQWNHKQLASILTADELKMVSAIWWDKHADDSEYGNLPRWQGTRDQLATKLNWNRERLALTLKTARAKMLQARAKRVVLPDTKTIAGWNGLALSALSAAYAESADDRYQLAGTRIVKWLTTRMWDGEHLLRAVDGKRDVAQASLEDYALVARGLWDWNQQFPDKKTSSMVEKLVRIAWQKYYVNERWLMGDSALIPMLGGRVAMEDSPLPSLSATITRLSLEHPRLKNDASIQALVKAHLDQVRAWLADAMLWYPGYVSLIKTTQDVR